MLRVIGAGWLVSEDRLRDAWCLMIDWMTDTYSSL